MIVPLGNNDIIMQLWHKESIFKIIVDVIKRHIDRLLILRHHFGFATSCDLFKNHVGLPVRTYY
jgi:hypothetical protein